MTHKGKEARRKSSQNIPRILTVGEAADLLGGMDLPTLRQWIRKGHIKHGKTPGGRLRFSETEVLRFRKELTGLDDIP